MTGHPGGSPGTWRRWIWDKWRAGWMRNYWGSRFWATIGLLFDSLHQALYDAWSAPMIRGPGPAYDALRPLGDEQSMPQYADETWVQYKARLENPWGTWQTAGTEQCIVDQLDLAGRPGAQIFHWLTDGHKSRFVVFYPAGSHPVTGPGPVIGSFTIGDDFIIGPVGITPSQTSTYIGLIKHWKPADWSCPHIIWELSGWTIGTPTAVIGDDLIIGGEQVRSTVQALTE